MNNQTLKKYVAGFVLMIAFVLVSGMAGISTAQAQGWGWGQDRGRWDDRDRYGRDRDWQRDRGYDNGRYRNPNYNRDLQKGYRDGLDRGQEDARDRRIATPNNSSHYRKGNEAYREGFRRGYQEGYRQYSYNRRRW